MLPEIVSQMPWTRHFSIQHEHPRRVVVQENSLGSNTAVSINAALQELVQICIDRNLFKVIGGRHSEAVEILSARYDQTVRIERFAANLFGLMRCGAHLIAHTKSSDGGMKIWVPRRAANLFTYPSLLDSTVAGGIKSGVSPLQTVVEEAGEEASLPEDFVRREAWSRGVISHMGLTGRGHGGEQGLVEPNYIYVYDIELPADMIPKPNDDEVGAFHCMTIEEVQTALLAEDFKPDSAAVMVDFLIRHGIITPENEPDFVDISMRLHRKLPFRTG
jgi:isopentenyldiphosphate isomerase